MKNEYVLDKLIELSGASFINMFDLCHKIGIEKPNTQDYKQIKALCEKYCIDLKFTYINNSIKKNNKKLPLDKILCENSTYSNNKLKNRILKEGLKENKCENPKCGISEWHGKPISLQIHHINGINNDNRLENLQLLCPNCHAQTDSFGGRNKKEYITTFGGRDEKIKKTPEEIASKKKEKWESSHPSKEELIKTFLEQKSYVKTGEFYNVSDNAIRKWFRHYDLPLNKRELRKMMGL